MKDDGTRDGYIEKPTCAECTQPLDIENDEYHREYGVCDDTCFARMVGLL